MLLTKDNTRKTLLNGVARAFDLAWPSPVKIKIPSHSRLRHAGDRLLIDQRRLHEEYENSLSDAIDLRVILLQHGVVEREVKSANRSRRSSMQGQRPKVWLGGWSPYNLCLEEQSDLESVAGETREEPILATS